MERREFKAFPELADTQPHSCRSLIHLGVSESGLARW